MDERKEKMNYNSPTQRESFQHFDLHASRGF